MRRPFREGGRGVARGSGREGEERREGGREGGREAVHFSPSRTFSVTAMSTEGSCIRRGGKRGREGVLVIVSNDFSLGYRRLHEAGEIPGGQKTEGILALRKVMRASPFLKPVALST